MLALLTLALVSIFAVVSARRQLGQADLLSEGAARAHGALWIQARDLVRSDRSIVARMAAVAASRSRSDRRYRALASVLGSELRYASQS